MLITVEGMPFTSSGLKWMLRVPSAARWYTPQWSVATHRSPWPSPTMVVTQLVPRVLRDTDRRPTYSKLVGRWGMTSTSFQ